MDFVERRARRGWLSFLKADALSQLDQHEATIVWFLNHRAANLTKDFENARREVEEREREASRIRSMRRSALASARPVEMEPIAKVPAMTSDSFAAEFGVSAAQMQELAQENDALVKEYSEMRNAITNTQASMNDIVRLQATLQDQLLYQEAQIDRIYDEATDTLDTVRKANAHLNRATSGQSTSVRFFLWFMVFVTLFVLVLHLISD